MVEHWPGQSLGFDSHPYLDFCSIFHLVSFLRLSLQDSGVKIPGLCGCPWLCCAGVRCQFLASLWTSREQEHPDSSPHAVITLGPFVSLPVTWENEDFLLHPLEGISELGGGPLEGGREKSQQPGLSSCQSPFLGCHGAEFSSSKYTRVSCPCPGVVYMELVW